MIHPHIKLAPVSESIGLGLFATQMIPRGTITWALDRFDFIFSDAEFNDLPEIYQAQMESYVYRDAEGSLVYCWDASRFMNHSCAPSTLRAGIGFDVAIRDIAAGEEVTCDYGEFNMDRAMPCGCSASLCRGAVRPVDFTVLSEHWDNLVCATLPLALEVPQLLWDLVNPGEQRQLRRVAEGIEPLSPLRRHHHKAAQHSAAGGMHRFAHRSPSAGTA